MKELSLTEIANARLSQRVKELEKQIDSQEIDINKVCRYFERCLNEAMVGTYIQPYYAGDGIAWLAISKKDMGKS